MIEHVANRDLIIDRLHRELVGPDPHGGLLRTVGDIVFADPRAEREEFKEDQGYIPRAFRPWRDEGTGDEILTQDRPCKRYGVGVLYPMRSLASDPAEPGDEDASEADDTGGRRGILDGDQEVITPEAQATMRLIEERAERRSDIEDPDETEANFLGTNAYLPSALGLSFLLELPERGTLRLSFTGGRYVPISAQVGERSRRWWRREQVSGSARLNFADLRELSGEHMVQGTFLGTEPDSSREAITLAFHVVARRQAPSENGRPCVLLTVTVVNRSPEMDPPDERCVFQSELRVDVCDVEGAPLGAVHPYPKPTGEHLDHEEEEIELLYRAVRTFAVGHGCAADWVSIAQDRAHSLMSRSLPVIETPSVTPEILVDENLDVDATGRKLEIPMAVLAGLIPNTDGFAALHEIIDAYAKWIERREQESLRIEGRYQAAATRHLTGCRTALLRMRSGLDTLKERGREGDLLRQAFRLANLAMCLQRVRTQERAPRRFEWDPDDERWVPPQPHPPEPTQEVLSAPAWRPFQIAFLLMALPSVAFGNDKSRDAVDLIWFPTGGGKTEAYLGLAAFSMLVRRLRALRRGDASEDAGVDVIMRYTLRLLTAQQFQRAAALLCAMEHIRRTKANGAELGSKEFVLAMWTGATPNTRSDARRAHKDLQQRGHAKDNIVVLERCPWCRAEMGVRPVPAARRGQENKIFGYETRSLPGSRADTVVAACADPRCAFHKGLPVRFVDQDIYDRSVDPPTMVIGTVDKFAVLSWRPEARVLFGRDDNGSQRVSPPGLILQDELHLIAGPLGTLVGLYETAVERLCTDTRDGGQVPPKIVASTATIRSYRDQVRRLYAREEVYLFPPPALDASDSFFARRAVDGEGRPLPGRKFVGVHAPGLGSVQTTQVRTFSSLLQASSDLSEDAARDPWHTLLVFYNSLRELGGGLTLFHSDVPDFLRGGIRQRQGLTPDQMRKLFRVEELTGRLENQEVVSVISKLEVEVGVDHDAVDVCLASNIIEVGVDIDRLSLITVVGQPKSTAQYIQVTGRIGRKWWERPGVVVTIYAPSKPRDRSHYERFRTYHERLYAQVEPTSVTPFSPPALERGLHGALVAFVRQTASMSKIERPSVDDPVIAALVTEFSELARSRLQRVQQGERTDLDQALARRFREWSARQPRRWQGPVTPDQSDVPLLRRPGQYANRNVRRLSWLTPTSMRNVDAECRVGITAHYVELDTGSTGPEDNNG